MKGFESNDTLIDYRHILEQAFDTFDVVVYIDEEKNSIQEIKSSEKFPLLHSSDDATKTLDIFGETVYPDDLRILEAFNLFSGQKLTSEIRCKNIDDKYRWCFCQFIPVNKTAYFAMFLDLSDCENEGIRLKNKYMTKQNLADVNNQLVKQKYNAIINHADIVLVEYNVGARKLTIGSNLQRQEFFIPPYNGSFDEFIAGDMIAEEDKPLVWAVREKLNVVNCIATAFKVKRSKGEGYVKCDANFYGVYEQGGGLHSIIGSVKPVYEEIEQVGKKSEDSIKYLDLATGLLNGKAFCDRLKKILNENEDKNYAVIMLDIDRFKSVNEVYGVQFGDRVIKHIALNLNELFCKEDCLTARFMSDFFGIFLSYENESELGRAIKILNGRISFYKHIPLKYSYGVYRISDRSIPARLMCDYANMAKNSVKGNHINNIAFYTEGMKNRIIEEINIENDMEKALEEEQFSMYLQPKYNIEDCSVVGAEALARWNHPSKGFIKPAKFIPLFEKNGFIVHLDAYIWEQACKTIRKWCDMGITPVSISVNVSRVNLKNPKLIEILDGLIEKYNIDKKYLELEITETVYYDDQQGLVNVLDRLKKSGYTLLMDDFGSGFSSLSMLKNTPFDVLKIDRNFLNETMITDRGKKIIRHTIYLSNDIGMNTVAEGVETKEQADYLLKCGCSIAQGYYYSKPVPVENFEEILGYKSTYDDE